MVWKKKNLTKIRLDRCLYLLKAQLAHLSDLLIDISFHNHRNALPDQENGRSQQDSFYMNPCTMDIFWEACMQHLDILDVGHSANVLICWRLDWL